MRPVITGLLATAGLLLASCGSADTDSVTAEGSNPGDDASAVTVAGADAGLAEEGDDRPEGEDDAASVISVKVDIPVGVELAGLAIIALEDITYADAEAIEIGRVEVPAAELGQQDNTVDVFLPLPLDGSIDVTATVHIDVDESGSFSPGDWISPDLVPVGPESGLEVTVRIVQI